MGKSVVPPTFFRRSIGDPVQLLATPIGDPVQLFDNPAELHAGIDRGSARQNSVNIESFSSNMQ